MELRSLVDRGGRRVIKERRFFQYGVFWPDNRDWKDRRSGSDRRKKPRYTFCEETIKMNSDKSEKVLFQIATNAKSDNFSPPRKKAPTKSSNQKDRMSSQKEYQADRYSGLPKHWHLQDPLDEVYFSEMLKRDMDENAYIVYCIDTYNAYRLTDEQKTKFESFDISALNDIRANLYSRNDLIKQFKQS